MLDCHLKPLIVEFFEGFQNRAVVRVHALIGHDRLSLVRVG
ncbi:hypothetical protein BSU04_30415 [Caballeronia sordidicola]|uniref:Uncharacterized protein n=1 Tax=Caballeronia sordidicola TaxID=196367 RepID=A0A226WU95_CABSO|nr:hypothetical protein BSU04_30415 [Caballeronia sordidicola]